MKGLNWKSIALGVVVDFAATIAASMVGLIVAGIVLTPHGVSEEQLESHMMTWLPFLIASLIFGLGTTAWGGFIAAGGSSSREAALKNAAAMGMATIVLGAIASLAVQDKSPLWYNIVSYTSIIPAALLGGHVRWRRTEKTNNRVLEPLQPPIPLP